MPVALLPSSRALVAQHWPKQGSRRKSQTRKGIVVRSMRSEGNGSKRRTEKKKEHQKSDSKREKQKHHASSLPTLHFTLFFLVRHCRFHLHLSFCLICVEREARCQRIGAIAIGQSAANGNGSHCVLEIGKTQMGEQKGRGGREGAFGQGRVRGARVVQGRDEQDKS